MQVSFCRAAGAQERASSREELTTRDAKKRPSAGPYCRTRRLGRISERGVATDELGRSGKRGGGKLLVVQRACVPSIALFRRKALI
jgi:hypothetical protein